ncbi:winged helix-turn-helix domain-containing protein [Acidianus brierleyi]|uniref:ArnR1-like winged helix-turn-helix domain-containing protein n=1 Tax=Acidianus brierleyi TaxID=41673 RepID=A0A2U9IF95_9CREN|nr:winged helix-turn-helix domain-containing protein [Acidianus brierleyi]AWR94650.1 hypothetical protein DFR85_08635 [Acidianus brierleyi]
MYELKIILEAIKDGALNPGEVVVKTKLPRYEILAAFHILEELGLIETIYSKGSHKVYRLTNKGEEILDGLEKGNIIDFVVKSQDLTA